MDTVKQLMASGHTGPVLMASRRGLLPTIKATVFDPFVPLSVATPEGEVLSVTEISFREFDIYVIYYL